MVHPSRAYERFQNHNNQAGPQNMNTHSTLKKVGVASFIMMASVFLSRVIGVFREMTIAGVGGIQSSVDAYQIAFIIPEMLNHIVASGFLSVTFIPIFTHYLLENKEEDGFRIFSIIMNTFGFLLLVFIVIAMILAPQIVSIFAPGLKDPETLALAVRMTRIIIPAQFFFFTGGLLMAVQFAKERFFIPALAPLIYNGGIILGGLLLGSSMGMEGFAWGVLGGAFAGNFALQMFGAKRVGIKYFPLLSLSHPDLIKYIKLTLPLMVGLTMTFSLELLIKFFGSYLDAGSIAALNYAVRIMFVLVGLFGQAVGVASYPYLAKLATENKISELNQLLNQTLKAIFLVIPISILFIVLSKEIVIVLFQRGAFDSQASAVTAGILPFFMVGAFAFSAQNIVSRGFYAMQNTLFPVIFTTVCVFISLPVLWLFMKTMGAKGLALGLSITVAIQCFVLFECWNRQTRNQQKKQVYFFFLKMIPFSLVLWGLLRLFSDYLRTVYDPTFTGSVMIGTITSLLFCILFFVSGHLFAIEEIISFKTRMVKKIRG